MIRSRSFQRLTSRALASLVACSFAGCSDVGDGTAAGGGEDAAFDATGAGDTAPPSTPDAEVSGDDDVAVEAGGSHTTEDDAGLGQNSGDDGGEAPDDGVIVTDDAQADTGAVEGAEAGADAGTRPVDSGALAGVDAGVDAGTVAPVEAGVDAGLGVIVDAGADAMVDAGHEAIMDAQADVSVDAAHPVDATAPTPDGSGGGGGACKPVCDPTMDPDGICTNGPTTGSSASTCNETEMLFWAEDQAKVTAGDCLKCALNAGCLDDTVGDVGPDCDGLSGTVSATAAAGAGTSVETDCLGLLGCELQSDCGKGNVLDCYCGLGAGSTACKTTQTGSCKQQEEVGLGSTDPNFIQANLTEKPAQTAPTGGYAANKMVACAQRNCLSVCF